MWLLSTIAPSNVSVPYYDYLPRAVISLLAIQIRVSHPNNGADSDVPVFVVLFVVLVKLSTYNYINTN